VKRLPLLSALAALAVLSACSSGSDGEAMDHASDSTHAAQTGGGVVRHYYVSATWSADT
jgi:hypothetical protein